MDGFLCVMVLVPVVLLGGLLIIALLVGSFMVGYRRPFVGRFDTVMKEVGLEPKAMSRWTGLVDGRPVFVTLRPHLDTQGNNLDITVPVTFGPGGRCSSTNDRRARREPRDFSALYLLTPPNELPAATQAALVELARGGLGVVEWRDLDGTATSAMGWSADHRASLSIFTKGRTVAELRAQIRHVHAAARQLEATVG
jgi:hypothetical protein